MGMLRFLIFTLPWIAWPGVDDPFLGPKEACFLIGGWALLLHTWLGDLPQQQPWRNPWTRRFGYWVLAWGAWRFWGPFLSHQPGHGELVYNMHIWLPTLSVLMGLLLLHTLVTVWLTSPLHATIITQWVCYSGTAVAIYVIAQRCGVEQFYVAAPGEMTQRWFGGFGNVGGMACFLAPLPPLYLLFSKRRYLLYGGLVLVAIFLSGARYAWVSTGFSLLIYGYLRMAARLTPRLLRVLNIIVIGGSLVGFIFAWQPLCQLIRQDERYPIWQETIQLWKQGSPAPGHTAFPFAWTGHGLQEFPNYFMTPSPKLSPAAQAIVSKNPWMTAHNDGLQVLFEWGLIGMALILMSLWQTLRTSWQKRHTILGTGWLCSLAAFFILSLTYFPWHLAASAFLGLLILAMNERQDVA